MPHPTLTLTLPTTETGWLRIQGDASLQTLVEAANTPALLKQALKRSFSWQERNDMNVLRATLSPDQGPLWAAALLAWDTQIYFDSGDIAPYGAFLKREVKPAGRSSGILIRPEAEQTRWGVAEVARTRRDTPIVGVVAVVDMKGTLVETARVALTGVWQRTADLAQAPAQLSGAELSSDAIAKVAAAIAAEVDPRPNFLGSVEYRRAMAEVLSADALTQCMTE